MDSICAKTVNCFETNVCRVVAVEKCWYSVSIIQK